jgi:hypothetical protein
LGQIGSGYLRFGYVMTSVDNIGKGGKKIESIQGHVSMLLITRSLLRFHFSVHTAKNVIMGNKFKFLKQFKLRNIGTCICGFNIVYLDVIK